MGKRKPLRSKAAATAPRGKLVIVESPAKAKTIGKYLGRGYTVKARWAMCATCPRARSGSTSRQTSTPKYLVPRDKSKVVKELKESVQGRQRVHPGDRPRPRGRGDRLAPGRMRPEPTTSRSSRVVFHEITPEADRARRWSIRAQIDMDLVDAQQARRVLDRLVGYSVSPLLWKKVKRGLSAGRVQTAALRIVVEREREIEAFVPVEYWSLEADLHKTDAARTETRRCRSGRRRESHWRESRPEDRRSRRDSIVLEI